MNNINIHDIDPNTIADSKDILINTNIPVEERKTDYINQVKNPYFIKAGKVIVKMSFSETDTSATDCFINYVKITQGG